MFYILHGDSLKVFDFYGKGITKTGNIEMDYVQLKNEAAAGRDLPTKFTVCLSHFQEKFRGQQTLQFLDRNNRPLFYIYLYTFVKEEGSPVQIWMELQGEYIAFGNVGEQLEWT